jgi:hypothetical protein
MILMVRRIHVMSINLAVIFSHLTSSSSKSNRSRVEKWLSWNKLLTYNNASLEHLSKTHLDSVGSHTWGAVRFSVGSSHDELQQLKDQLTECAKRETPHKVEILWLPGRRSVTWREESYESDEF